jgi:hypothetical protein
MVYPMPPSARLVQPKQTTPPRGGGGVSFGSFAAGTPTLDMTHVMHAGGRDKLADSPAPSPVSVMDVQAARALQALCNATMAQQYELPTWPTPLYHYTEPPSPVARAQPHASPNSQCSAAGSSDPPKPTARDRFMADVARLSAANGTPLVRVPEMGSKALDLYALYQQVIARGGLTVVVENKLWKSVAQELRIPLGSCTDYGYRLRRHYERYLLTYEQMHNADVVRPCGVGAGGGKKRKHRSERRVRRRGQRESPGGVAETGPAPPTAAPTLNNQDDDAQNPYSKRAMYRYACA